jgi:transcription elongation factor GreA
MGFFYLYKRQIMSAISYYTAEGLKKLREELDYLKSVMRPASADIAEARDKGDLSEKRRIMMPRSNARNANCKTRRSTF